MISDRKRVINAVVTVTERTTAMIEELQGLSREELIKRWKKLFKTNSPQYAKKDFLIKHIIWEMQAKKQGGYSTQTKKKIDKLSESYANGKDKTDDNFKCLKENNTLEIKVTNLWVNRLIGDQQPGVASKITYTTQPFYRADSPLLPSGLLGPVKIISLK